jgi:5S rRNA maturation endonuclease (ribonuclease M5)
MQRVNSEVRDRLLPVPKDFRSTVIDSGCGNTFNLMPNYTWRGIKASTLRSCGVSLSFDIRSRRTVLILPVFIHEEFKGLVKAFEVKNKWEKNSYLTSRGDWVKDYGLFPFDPIVEWTKRLGYVVLVEGSRDALRLIQEGIPAMAILGAENWSASKLGLIRMLRVKIVVCMDGDVAGIEVSNKISASCKCYVYNMKKETLRYRKLAKQNGIDPESIKIDPANMPRKAVIRFKEWLNLRQLEVHPIC